jgi:hypothetical protein
MKALLMDSIPAIASLVDGEALPELQEVNNVHRVLQIQGPFEKFVDWWQCAAVTQREMVTVNAKL